VLFKKVHVFRVKPDRELPDAIADYCRRNNVPSGVVLGIIGSLKNARLNGWQLGTMTSAGWESPCRCQTYPV